MIMLIIERTDTYGWGAAIRGMRNPMNSWDKSDSFQCDGVGCRFEKCSRFDGDGCSSECDYVIGTNDYKLMSKLAEAGQVHGKFLRMITVTADVTAPLYWWKEFDTYKVGTVANSCSTMHKIHDKEFTFDDFSCEHLFNRDNEKWRPAYQTCEGFITSPYSALHLIISVLNTCREYYIKTNDKSWWWQMIRILPSSYNQKRTVQLNYAVLKNVYKYRKDHKLDEWHTFCEWIESLPYSELITS